MELVFRIYPGFFRTSLILAYGFGCSRAEKTGTDVRKVRLALLG
jgi:hypothetical protein